MNAKDYWLRKHLETWANGLYPDPEQAERVIEACWNLGDLKDLVDQGKSWYQIHKIATTDGF